MKDISLSLQACCSDATPVLVCHFMAAPVPFLNISEKHKSKKLQMEINISLSGDFMSELHRHTMVPSTPNASCGWWHTVLPTLQKLWMKNSVAQTEVTPHEPPRLCSWNFDRANKHKVETQCSCNLRLLSGQCWFSPVFSFRRRDCN